MSQALTENRERDQTSLDIIEALADHGDDELLVGRPLVIDMYSKIMPHFNKPLRLK